MVRGRADSPAASNPAIYTVGMANMAPPPSAVGKRVLFVACASLGVAGAFSFGAMAFGAGFLAFGIAGTPGVASGAVTQGLFYGGVVAVPAAAGLLALASDEKAAPPPSDDGIIPAFATEHQQHAAEHHEWREAEAYERPREQEYEAPREYQHEL